MPKSYNITKSFSDVTVTVENLGEWWIEDGFLSGQFVEDYWLCDCKKPQLHERADRKHCSDCDTSFDEVTDMTLQDFIALAVPPGMLEISIKVKSEHDKSL